MQTADFIDTLRRDGQLLAEYAACAGWDTEVPTCPEWKVRDLVAHTGSVHRWAGGYLDGRTDPVPLRLCAPESDAALPAWFREGHRRLVHRLAAASADLKCWTSSPALVPLAFWARRQAHETAIHRVDAEIAAGVDHTPFDGAFARDGIDELLNSLQSRPRNRCRTKMPRTLLLRVVADSPGDDGPNAWLLRLSDEPPRVLRLEQSDSGRSECTLHGSPDALYLALWNRGRYDELEAVGDPEFLEMLREISAV